MYRGSPTSTVSTSKNSTCTSNMDTHAARSTSDPGNKALENSFALTEEFRVAVDRQFAMNIEYLSISSIVDFFYSMATLTGTF